MLQKAFEVDFPILIDIWERSVRATHNFLPDAEIDNLKPGGFKRQVQQYKNQP